MCPESGKPLETDWRWISIQMMIQRFLMENQRPNYCSPACEHTQMKRNDELASQSGKNLYDSGSIVQKTARITLEFHQIPDII